MTSDAERAIETQKSKHAEAAGNTAANREYLKQKRARSQLSCTPCRSGKLKCSREKPACDQCTKRSREGSCVYVPPPAKNKPAQNIKGRIRQLETLVVDLMNQNRSAQQTRQARAADEAPGSRRADTINVDEPFSEPTPPRDNDPSPDLTGSSGQPIGAHGNATLPSYDDLDAATTLTGRMRISRDEIAYVGDSHWNAILNSISDLKRELGDEDRNDEDDGDPLTLERENFVECGSWSRGVPQNGTPMGGIQPHATTGLGLLLGGQVPETKLKLLSSVPEKRVADRLLSLWFNSPDPFKPIVHAPTFQAEYKRFWADPKSTSVMWLGLFYSILSLAASFGLRDSDPSSPHAQNTLEEVNRYHSLAASAAVLGDFTRPREYTIECLVLYAAGLRSNNAFVNVWLMIGLIVRLALRMGYHRDPKHYPNITPFQGEMRRRTWCLVNMLDVLISFQLGLPSMVRTITSDTEPPRNLLDRDFGPDTEVLPEGRGVHELTPSSYTRAKLRITKVFADAAELSHATVPPAYEQILELDGRLEEAKEAVPPLLRMPDTSDLVTDPAEQLMCRFNLDLLYLKTKMVLHRRFMNTPFADLSVDEQAQGIGHSRKACINCAHQVLQHHHTIYTASQSGGQLESVKWYMGSISTHDFLLAAMIICLELSNQINQDTFQTIQGGFACPHQANMMDALEKSQMIWEASSRRKTCVANAGRSQFQGNGENVKGEHMSDETEKAAKAVAVMLQKVRERDGKPPIQSDPVVTETRHRPFDHRRGDADGGVPFIGLRTTHQWGGEMPDPFAFMDSTPECAPFTNSSGPGAHDDFDTGNAGVNAAWRNTNSANQLPNGGGASFEQTVQNDGLEMSSAPDFSMIGDMLDLFPDHMDWCAWDAQIAGNSTNLDLLERADAQGGLLSKRAGEAEIDESRQGPEHVIPDIALLAGGTGVVDTPGSSDALANLRQLGDSDTVPFGRAGFDFEDLGVSREMDSAWASA